MQLCLFMQIISFSFSSKQILTVCSICAGLTSVFKYIFIIAGSHTSGFPSTSFFTLLNIAQYHTFLWLRFRLNWAVCPPFCLIFLACNEPSFVNVVWLKEDGKPRLELSKLPSCHSLPAMIFHPFMCVLSKVGWNLLCLSISVILLPWTVLYCWSRL